MASDEGDIESSKATAGFGDVDRLSGFFTPVWESKKRIRSETPIPSSRRSRQTESTSARERDASAAEVNRAAVTSAAGGHRAVGVSRAAVTSAAGVSRAAVATETSGRAGRGATSDEGPRDARPLPSKAKATTATPSVEAGSTRAKAGTGGRAATTDEGTQAGKAASPQKKASPRRTATSAAKRPGRSSEPSAARVADDETAGAAGLPSPARAARAGTRASAAEQAAEPELPPEAFFDEEPDFRLPSVAKTESPRDRAMRQRSHRATVAATHLHEQLKASWKADAAREAKDTVRDLKAEPAASGSAPDPLSIPVIRRFRRTIQLASPLPEPLRSAVLRARNN